MPTQHDPNPLVLVTGGTGLIGAHLLSDLLRRPVRIRAVKRRSSDLRVVRKILGYYHPDPDTQLGKIEWVDVNLLSESDLQTAFSGVDDVYHCAGMVSFDPKERQQLFDINVGGTANIVRCCLKTGVRKLCHVSSSSSLGKPTGEEPHPIDETTPWNSSDEVSDYALSKYQSEQEVWRGCADGLPAVIINPTIVIGPGDWNRSSSKLFRTIWKGFPFYSAGVNAFVDVRDVSRVAIQLMDSDIAGERFVVAAENLPFKQLFDCIADNLSKKRPAMPVTPWMGAMAWRLDWLGSKLTGKPPQITRSTVVSARKRYYFSNEKIRQRLGFEFTPIAQSIRDTSLLFLAEH